MMLLLAVALSGCPLWDPDDGGFVVENYSDVELTVYPVGDDPGDPTVLLPRAGRSVAVMPRNGCRREYRDVVAEAPDGTVYARWGRTPCWGDRWTIREPEVRHGPSEYEPVGT